MGRGWKVLLAAGSVVVVLQAAILTAVAFPAPHTGGDNAAYLALAHALTEGLGYVELWDPDVPAHTKYPPGYPLVLGLLMLGGAATWTAFKLSSAVAISGATLAAFAWAAHRGGALAAGALGLLLVLGAGWQEASRWILSEPWFLLWVFLSLWTAERALSTRRDGGEGGRDRAAGGVGWWVAAGAAALLAFGVRTAGLPLVVALLGALVLARRWRAAVGFGVAAAALVGGWALRAAGGGEGAYQSEFFLRNPYDPSLGTVGPPELLGRVWANLSLYVGQVLPGEWWGTTEGWGAVAGGLLLIGFALWGWISRLRPRPGPVELFVPLYAGTILLWPEVWSGDRFLLPLVPPILVYAGEAAAAVARRVARGRGWNEAAVARAVVAAGVVALALPALPSTLDRAAEGRECRARAQAADDVFACHGSGFREFRVAAGWMGRHLPDDAVALSRKPRILHLLGGPRGRTFPFSDDPEAFLRTADDLGARYLLLDLVDGMALRYMDPMVGSRPGAFCHLATWQSGSTGRGGTALLGILPPGERTQGDELGECPAGWAPDAAREEGPVEGRRVPLLISWEGPWRRGATPGYSSRPPPSPWRMARAMPYSRKARYGSSSASPVSRRVPTSGSFRAGERDWRRERRPPQGAAR